MRNNHSFMDFEEGRSNRYAAPAIEVCELTVEQGFANSSTGSWDNSIDKDVTWGEGDDNLF